MENTFDNSKYNNYIIKIKKKLSKLECLFIIIRLYLTKNLYYYILCIIIRFIPLISISGDYISLNRKLFLVPKNNKYQSLQQFLKNFTCYNLIKQLNLSNKSYFKICIFIYILFIIRLINYFNIIKGIKDPKNIKCPSPNKYQVLMDHFLFLTFPYILEFLSFSYYIYLYGNNSTNEEKFLLIIFIIINSILIIIYNINNYFFIICSNRIYLTTKSEVYNTIKNGTKSINNKSIKYKCSKMVLFIFVLFQNVVLFQSLENYINNLYKIYFKIIASIIIVVNISILIIKLLRKYNYRNFINSLINVLLLFCFYTIIIDIFLFIYKYKLQFFFLKILFILIKLILSYITNLLIILKVDESLENKIKELLFHEKNIDIQENIEDLLIYLNEIMLKIKEIKDCNSLFILLQLIYNHINICNKIKCNCKLLNIFIQNLENLNKKKIHIISKNLLIILNYLYESSFLEYKYYNRYDMTILLAEHFCHIRDNPTMAFSFINSLIINNKNNKKKFSMYQMVGLYELCQKYIYYILFMEKFDKNYEIIENNNHLISKNERFKYFKNIFNSLNLSNKTKEIINNYIDNLLYILKCRQIFDESLSFNFDDNNENIKSIKINFFEENSLEIRNKSNLYNVIYLLNKNRLYYNNLIDSIKTINIFKDLPIFMAFKYFLFFDFVEGREIPKEISNQLYFSIFNNQNIYNNKITDKIISLLKLKYIEQNYRTNSKFFAIYEYKNELTTKYFSEECALRLGYKQKDIINKTIDKLMPNEFCKSHQNLIKKIIIGEQLKYYNVNKSYLFDITNTKLYPIIPKGILIYNLSKNLIILSENIFKKEKEYNFMLNNNFQIIAISKNFEDEYLLNQKIFLLYDLKLLEILEIKKDKLYKKFENEFQIINQNNLIRQIKTEEYLIPQLYVPNGDLNKGKNLTNNFNNSKNHILFNILKLNNDEELNETKDDMDENSKLIKNINLQNNIIKYFCNKRKIVIHKRIYYILNKYKFIDNLYKELTKIPDNELNLDKSENNNLHNLIINSQKLTNNLLLKKELLNNFIRITITFSYFYDKIFYFITINDEKKKYLKLSNQIIFENINNQIISNDIIDIGKSDKEQKSRNINFMKKNTSTNLESKNEKEDSIIMINEIEKYMKDINQEGFILMIKYILLFILICIFIIYMTLIDYQKNSLNITENILLAYYYNVHMRGIFFNTLSKINGIYYDASKLVPLTLSQSYIDTIIQYSYELRKNYRYFTEYFINYNVQIGKSFNTLFQEKKFYMLKGFFQEIPYYSNYCREYEYLIYEIRSINVTKTPEFDSDVKNFLFYKKDNNKREKVYTNYIRLLYYMTINYEYTFKNCINEINNEIYLSYKNYFKKIITIYYILESGGILLYLLFFILIMIYLYYSNMIIIKNIIFLFLDFEDKFEQNYDIKRNKNENLIRYKLMKFKDLINDFDLNRLQNYFNNINNINNINKCNYIQEEKEKEILQDNFNNKLRINIEKNNNKIERRDSINKIKKEKVKINQKEIIQKSTDQTNNTNSNYEINMMQNNNSSYNYFLRANTNYFKSIRSYTAFFPENNKINSNKNIIPASQDYKIKKNKLNNNEIDIKDNIQNTILNKSNKSIIYLIKKYIIIMIIIILLIIIYSLYKINYNNIYIQQSNYFYNDFKIISTKYSYLYYYFITLKSLLIYHENSDRWKDALYIMENYYKDINQLDKEYNEILKHRTASYKYVSQLLELLQYNKNDSSEYIKNIICSNLTSCQNYLQSEDNIFYSGIDYGFKTCFTFMNNIVLDYKTINNKTNVDEIIASITGPQLYEFKRLRKAFSNIFFYVQEMIYSSFEIDQNNFRKQYRRNMNILNILSFLFSILVSLFAFIFIFIGIRNFTKRIKDSTLRINLSFYYIKNYNFE